MSPESLSPSQINLYLTCSLKYRFQYIDRLPKLTHSASLVFGGAIHAALEWLHKERKKGKPPPLDEILRVFEADWNAQIFGETVAFADNGDSPEAMIRKGKELLSQFFHQFACSVKEAELHFQLPLVHPTTGEVVDVPLRGVIDLVEEGDVLDEFKTSQKSWSASDLPDNVQLTAYAYAYRMLFGHPAKMLRIVNLVRTKNVKIEPMTTERGEADYARLFHLGKEVRKGVTGQVFIPSRGCWMCKDCEYDRDCREWTGNER
jgi:putative RecB family exonuclease